MVQVFIDIASESEIGSDGFPSRSPFGDSKFDCVAFELESRLVNLQADNFDIAVNAGEDDNEVPMQETEESRQVIDIVNSFNLQLYQDATKTDFKNYIMNYAKTVLLPRIPEDKMDEYKAAYTGLIKKMLENFGAADWYFGSGSGNAEDSSQCHPIYAYYPDGELSPRFIYFRSGIKIEKY